MRGRNFKYSQRERTFHPWAQFPCYREAVRISPYHYPKNVHIRTDDPDLPASYSILSLKDLKHLIYCRFNTSPVGSWAWILGSEMVRPVVLYAWNSAFIGEMLNSLVICCRMLTNLFSRLGNSLACQFEGRNSKGIAKLSQKARRVALRSRVACRGHARHSWHDARVYRIYNRRRFYSTCRRRGALLKGKWYALKDSS